MKHAPRRPSPRRHLSLPSPRRLLPLAAACGLALSLAACAAATRPADPSAPRANEAPYPVLLEASGARRDRALANWGALVTGAAEAAVPPQPELRPVTATVSGIPPLPASLLRLPKVVIEARPGEPAREPTEEELRESLRRFVASAAPLLGVDPRELSLVEVADAGGGARRALYRQKPFQHPLRNGYGEVSITFAPDLSVTAMSSTAIPDVEPLRRALAAVVPQLSAEDAVRALAGKAVAAAPAGPVAAANSNADANLNAGGAAPARTITSTEGVAARELVVFPRPAQGSPDRVELRLAWEVDAGGAGGPSLVYVDAVTGDILGPAAS